MLETSLVVQVERSSLKMAHSCRSGEKRYRWSVLATRLLEKRWRTTTVKWETLGQRIAVADLAGDFRRG